MKAMKRFLQTGLVLMALIVSSGVFLVVQPAEAAPASPPPSPFSSSQQQACSGIDLGSGSSSCASQATGAGVSSLISTTIDILSFVVGAVAIIMVIIGGFKYVISSGDSNAANSARNTILYALVGLAIAAVAQVLVRFVLNKVG